MFQAPNIETVASRRHKTADQSKAACPVEALAHEFDVLAREYNVQDAKSTDSEGAAKFQASQAMMIIWDRMDAIREEVSYLTPSTKMGAAFQIMIAAGHLDILTDVDGPEQRKIEAQMLRLSFNAVQYLMADDERIAYGREYCMGSHLDPHAILRDLLSQSAAVR